MVEKRLIIGIDPGTTTGIAAISLSKKLLQAASKKGFGYNELTSWITGFGKPSLIATDKSKVPTLVSRIAAAFNCPVFTPAHDLTLRQKTTLTASYDINNEHQRDALAAALAAYEHHAKLIKKVEKTVDTLSLHAHADRIKDQLLRGKARNLAEAIDNVLGRREARKNPALVEALRRLHILEKVLTKREEELATLRTVLKKLERKLEASEQLRAAREAAKLRIEVRSLRERLRLIERKKIRAEKTAEILRKMEIARKDRIVIKIVQAFDLPSLLKVKKRFGIWKDILLFESCANPEPSVIKELVKNKIHTIIIPSGTLAPLREKLDKAGIATIQMEKLIIDRRNGWAVVEKENLQKTLKIKRDEFLKWLKKYRLTSV